MRRFRLSIRAVMAIIVLAALGFAALRNADPFWAGVVAFATYLLLAASILGVVYRREAKRAFWLGFALMGIGYAMIAHEFVMGGSSDHTGKIVEPEPKAPLVTAALLDRLKPFLGPVAGASTGTIFDSWLARPRDRLIFRALDKIIDVPFAQETPLTDVIKYIQKSTVDPPDLPNGIPIYVEPTGLLESEKTLQSPIAYNITGVPLKTSLRLILKQLDLYYKVRDGLLIIDYVGNQDSIESYAFERVGHCLITLGLGVIGGALGLLFHATRDRT